MALTSQQHKVSLQRKLRTRSKLQTNMSIPRLSVHRTLRHIYAQVIDDLTGKTMASASDLTVTTTGNKTEVAQKVGEAIADLAKKNKIEAVRFDRGSYKYHGRVAALADAARKQGLQF